MTPPASPIGRRAEWEALQDRLARHRSAVVLLTGPPGSGRTYLLRSLGEAAKDAGFAVAGCEESLPIEPTTQLSDVARALAAVLGEKHQQNQDVDSGRGRVLKAIRSLGDLVQTERLIFTTIDTAAPVLIGVDGYMPSTTMQTWIVSRLVPHVRRQRDPILLVFTDRAEALSELRSIADEVHDLGSLNVTDIQEHLRTVTTELQPPLSVEELEAYATAAANDPSLLGALEAVFRTANTRA